jgi:PEP-CTERM motif
MLMRLLVFGLLVVCAQSARAIVVTFDADASSGNTYVYNVSLDPGAFMQANADPTSPTQNAFTLYDFPGLVSATFEKDAGLPLNEFVLSTPTTGFNPVGIRPQVDTALPNITVRLDSGPQINPDPEGDPLPLGTLTVIGPFAAPTQVVEFSGQAIQKDGKTRLGNWSTTVGPIPEPSTVGLMGAGLAAVAVLALRRRKTQH